MLSQGLAQFKTREREREREREITLHKLTPTADMDNVKKIN